MMETEIVNSLKNAFDKNEKHGLAQDFQKDAWNKFKRLGLPTRKKESYQYVPLQKVFENISLEESDQNAFEIPKILERHPTLTFINGKLSYELSQTESLPKELLILSLSEAKLKFGAHLKGRLEQLIKKEKDSFALINQSLSSNGVFIYIPPGMQLDDTITIRQYITADSGFVSPSIYIFSGASSKVTFNQDFTRLDKSQALCNSFIDLHLEKEAKTTVNTIEKPSNKTWFFHTLRANLKAESSLNLFDFNFGAMSRHDYHVSLNEPNCNASLSGLWACHKDQQAHAHVLMEHKAPSCVSSQLFKGVLSANGRSSFEGKIYIHSEAQQTEAYQSNHNLLLSDTAFGASKPNLEIFADDVKASHGSTTGQIDKDQLFYLRSRGLSEEKAKHLLIKAFCADLISQIEDADFERVLQKELSKALGAALQ